MRCKACGADLIFIKTKIGGKPMPCDVNRVYYGPGKKDKVITPKGEVISCRMPSVRSAEDTYHISQHVQTRTNLGGNNGEQDND